MGILCALFGAMLVLLTLFDHGDFVNANQRTTALWIGVGLAVLGVIIAAIRGEDEDL